MPSHQPTEHVVTGFGTDDVTVMKIHTQEMIRNLQNLPKGRELALAITKLQEAVMWMDEHQRLS